MITVAKQLIDNPDLKNPTVLMLVDRNELEGQLFLNLEAVGFGHVTVADSKRHLQELFRDDRRGLIVSMIHKFDDIPEKISERANIFVLIDEAHRTTGGDLGNYLLGAVPNATFIGFTGTPIDRIAYGRGTFKVFGKDDERGYLDKYPIAESIADGTTLPLHYTLAPNDVRVPRELLEEEFWNLAETEGISDIDELNAILERAVNLRAFLKASDRIEKVAAFIAHHYQDNVEPLGYKAFVVGVDREACALYKAALDRHLPSDYSAVVYTSRHNDDALLAVHRLDADEVAKMIGFPSRAALRARLGKHGFPTVQVLRDWMLLLYAMEAWDLRGLPLEQWAWQNGIDPSVAYRAVKRAGGIEWKKVSTMTLSYWIRVFGNSIRPRLRCKSLPRG